MTAGSTLQAVAEEVSRPRWQRLSLMRQLSDVGPGARRLRLAPRRRSSPGLGRGSSATIPWTAPSVSHLATYSYRPFEVSTSGAASLPRVLCRRWRRNTTDGISERPPNRYTNQGSNGSGRAASCRSAYTSRAAPRRACCQTVRHSRCGSNRCHFSLEVTKSEADRPISLACLPMTAPTQTR
jgi:hypothetical protein